MRMVIDANILFSFFKRSSYTRDLIITHPEIELFVPSFVFMELERYKDVIIKKARIDERIFDITMEEIQNLAQTSPMKDMIRNWDRAQRICPDPDDIHYFAVAIELDCIIWSNDKRLKEQNEIIVVNTLELSSILRENS
jgi:predicted nucleic acid-binding protein